MRWSFSQRVLMGYLALLMAMAILRTHWGMIMLE